MFAVTWLGLLVTVPLRFLCKNAGLHTGTRNTASFGTEFYIVKHDIRFRIRYYINFFFQIYIHLIIMWRVFPFVYQKCGIIKMSSFNYNTC